MNSISDVAGQTVAAEDKPRDIIVLGAGVAGLSAAKLLTEAGHRVRVIEAGPNCGGAHRSHEIGPYTFDVGSIFYEENARLLQLAPGLEDICPPVRRVQRRISPEGKLLHYPLEPRDLLSWPKLRLAKGLADMILTRMTGRLDGTLETACRTRLGRTIFEGTGLHSYIARFHHVPAKEIDESFFFHRMGFVEKSTRTDALFRAAWRVLTRKPFRKGPRASLRVRPADGFSILFTRIRDHLEAMGIEFLMNETLEKIEMTENGAVVQTSQGTHTCDVIVASIPLDTVHRALFDRPSGLRSLDLQTLFISASYVDKDAGNVLFNFHSRGRWKRATVYSRIYPDRDTEGREFFALEITLPPGMTPDPEAAFADAQVHLTELGVARDMKMEGHDIVDSAYPLYAPGTASALTDVISRISETGVVPVGRQGRFEYLPTSTGVIRRVGEELANGGLFASAPATQTTDSD